MRQKIQFMERSGEREAKVSESKSRVFVEVGMGDMRRRGYGEQFPFRLGDFYIGADLRYVVGAEGSTKDDLLPIRISKRALERAVITDPEDTATAIGFINHVATEEYANQRGIQFVPLYANGLHLPFADNSVEQVLLSNVLGDSGMHAYPKSCMLEEAQRVVKVGGFVVAKETYTPIVAHNFVRQYRIACDIYTDVHPEWVDFQGQYDLGVTAGTIIRIPTATEDKFD